MPIIYKSEEDVLQDTQRIDAIFSDIYTTYTDVRVKRQDLLGTLESAIKKLLPSEDDKSTMLLAKVALLNSYRDVLKDTEESPTKIANVYLKKREIKTNEDISKDVVTFLKELQKQKTIVSSDVIDQNQIEHIISADLQKNNVTISRGELKESAYDFNE
jgi:gluconate kinase